MERPLPLGSVAPFCFPLLLPAEGDASYRDDIRQVSPEYRLVFEHIEKRSIPESKKLFISLPALVSSGTPRLLKSHSSRTLLNVFDEHCKKGERGCTDKEAQIIVIEYCRNNNIPLPNGAQAPLRTMEDELALAKGRNEPIVIIVEQKGRGYTVIVKFYDDKRNPLSISGGQFRDKNKKYWADHVAKMMQISSDCFYDAPLNLLEKLGEKVMMQAAASKQSQDVQRVLETLISARRVQGPAWTIPLLYGLSHKYAQELRKSPFATGICHALSETIVETIKCPLYQAAAHSHPYATAFCFGKPSGVLSKFNSAQDFKAWEEQRKDRFSSRLNLDVILAESKKNPWEFFDKHPEFASVQAIFKITSLFRAPSLSPSSEGSQPAYRGATASETVASGSSASAAVPVQSATGPTKTVPLAPAKASTGRAVDNDNPVSKVYYGPKTANATKLESQKAHAASRRVQQTSTEAQSQPAEATQVNKHKSMPATASPMTKDKVVPALQKKLKQN